MQVTTARAGIDLNRLIRAALLAGGALLIAKLFVTGQMVKYMSPALDPLTAVAAAVLLAMAVVELRQALAGPGDAAPDHAHDHGHDDHGHHHATSASEAGLTYLLLVVTLGLGLVLTPRALSASALGGEDLASYLLAFEPRVSTVGTAAPTAATPAAAPIEDLTALVAQTQLTGEGIVGQPVRVVGLTAPSGGLGPGEFALLRYTIVHCVADARPFGLVVAAAGPPPVNGWVQVEGRVAIRERQGARLLAIEATAVTPIAEPENPYIRPSQ